MWFCTVQEIYRLHTENICSHKSVKTPQNKTPFFTRCLFIFDGLFHFLQYAVLFLNNVELCGISIFLPCCL